MISTYVFLVIVNVWVVSATPEPIQYAGTKKVGVYRGKSALHDCSITAKAIQAGLSQGEVVLCIPYEAKDTQ